jgi:hypothetical protein
METQPPFLTLRQIPKHVSKNIESTAIKTSGVTGARIDNTAKAKICSLVVI